MCGVLWEIMLEPGSALETHMIFSTLWADMMPAQALDNYVGPQNRDGKKQQELP